MKFWHFVCFSILPERDVDSGIRDVKEPEEGEAVCIVSIRTQEPRENSVKTKKANKILKKQPPIRLSLALKSLP